jgi:hypothetical protein
MEDKDLFEIGVLGRLNSGMNIEVTALGRVT